MNETPKDEQVVRVKGADDGCGVIIAAIILCFQLSCQTNKIIKAFAPTPEPSQAEATKP